MDEKREVQAAQLKCPHCDSTVFVELKHYLTTSIEDPMFLVCKACGGYFYSAMMFISQGNREKLISDFQEVVKLIERLNHGNSE